MSRLNKNFILQEMFDGSEEKLNEYRNQFSIKPFASDIILCQDDILVKKALNIYKKEHGKNLTYLNIGAGRHCKEIKGYQCDFLENDEHFKDKKIKNGKMIVADVCNCYEIPDETYDIVYSNSVFEHIKEPWKASEECVRITKKGGLNIHTTLFSWRYHPCPVDCYRYTHTGLSYLFERTEKMETLCATYCIPNRRLNGVGHPGKGKDTVPIDSMGGWLEQWAITFIGKRNK